MAAPGKERWPDDGGISKIVADELVQHGNTNWNDDMLADYLCRLLDIPSMFLSCSSIIPTFKQNLTSID